MQTSYNNITPPPSASAPWAQAASEASQACMTASKENTANSARKAAEACWKVCGMINHTENRDIWDAWNGPAEYWLKRAKDLETE